MLLNCITGHYPRDQRLSELVEPCAETTWRARGEFLRGGTNSSNPSPSSGESTTIGSCRTSFILKLDREFESGFLQRGVK